MDTDKDKLIKRDLSKYKKIFTGADENKKLFAEKLYTQAAFMNATLCELAETIKKEGAVITAVNGNGFETTSEHPAQKSYNAMIKNYNAAIKSLIDLLPDGRAGADELMEFLRK